MSITGAHSLLRTLAELGVEAAFALPGTHSLPLWDALDDLGGDVGSLRLLGVRHEPAAAHAADGYARVTGGLGVAVVTTGPGALGTLRALGEAAASASPVLLIATEAPSTLRTPGPGSLAEHGDQRAFFASLTKATFAVEHPDDIAAVVRRAAETAVRPRSGPVYVGVPADFLGESAEPVTDGTDGAALPSLTAPPLSAVPAEDMEAARAALVEARRPLIWAGGGALRSGAGEAIGVLAERLAAPIVTTFAARGIVPPDHPCLASNPVHAPEVGLLWDDADVVLAIGTDFDGVMTRDGSMPQPPGLIAVNVDAEGATKHYPPDLLLLGDAREVVEELSLGILPKPGLDELTRRLDDIEVRVRRRVRKEEPRAAEFLAALKETVPEGSVLVPDTCVAGYWIGSFYRVSGPRELALPLGRGTVGFGFPASLGVAAGGAVRAVCVTSDGAFLTGCAELATAIQEKLPVTVVIVDDGLGRYACTDSEQYAQYPADPVTDPLTELVTPDFVGLAKSFGVHADRVDGFGRAFRRLLREFTRSDEPNVLVVSARLRPPRKTSTRW
ncbi:thiamine pyrophosphate-binding protein [Saccharomonospora azurea]|uniref:thiamine pyrophosphate-binding protein n=1 Tax=Saccharomonospora azurea TaxID=40988 RepID=UPI0024098C26|nr:thiamine pyrophosphate-binding protein [Saccharomonospora azurea]